MAKIESPLTLGTKSISKLLVQYSVPAIIASVATSLYNIVDSIFIGQGVGPMAIAGLAITFPLMNLVVAFCTLIAVGGATISSIFIGQKNESRATDVVNNVMVLCLIHSILFGGLTLIFLDDILIFSSNFRNHSLCQGVHENNPIWHTYLLCFHRFEQPDASYRLSKESNDIGSAFSACKCHTRTHIHLQT